MITIKTMIPYDNENNYCLLVKEEDKALATELINKAYNAFLNDEIHTGFQEYAEILLTEHNIQHEFSLWEVASEEY